MDIAIEGHFLARDTGTLAGSGYEITAGNSGVLDCVELNVTTSVTPDAGTVQFTLRDGSPVPQITTGGSPVEELTFSAAGNQLTINVDAGANTSLDSGFRRLLISNTGGTMKACCQMIEQLNGIIVGIAFLVELDFLNGRAQLADYTLHTVINYEQE